MLFNICNTLMRANAGMLLADTPTTETGTAGGIIDDTASAIETVVKSVLTAIIGLATLAAVVYAGFLIVKFMRADSAEKREEAKKRIIYAVIGIVVGIVFIVLVQFLTGYFTNFIENGTWTKSK